MRSRRYTIGMLMMPLLPAILHGCLPMGTTQISAISVERIRRDICTKVFVNVTTSRHDILTDETKFLIAQDKASKNAYCR